MKTLKILIVGGYGIFGGRIVELLESEPRFTILVAGRSIDKASTYCATRGHAKSRLVPAAFDRNGDVRGQLAALKPDILVDASGPFQAYGERRYELIQSCIALRIHYLDLADGSDFVAGVGAFDEAARAAKVYVLSGVSSFPVLTAAAVRRLSSDMRRVDTIRGGIAPSPFAVVGENVIRAISGYAGRRIEMRRNGAVTAGYPFTEQMRFTIAPPGYVPLRSTLFSLVDVPDLRALPDLWPDVKDVWMGAGPVPSLLHRALIGFAWLVRLRLLPSLSFLAGPIHFVIGHVRWGEHRGGMFIEVVGIDASGAAATRSWHLLAEGEDGPLIPSMAVAAILRKTLLGVAPQPGARAAVRDLELEDYDALFAGRTIVTGFRETAPLRTPLYARVLATAWDRLPGPIRDMHDVTGNLEAEGRADIDRGRGALASMVAAIFGFPKAGRDVPVKVQFKVSNGTEIWTRTFGARRFSSKQFEGAGRSERLLCERFGLLTFAMALVPQGERLNLVLRRWTCFGIPLPMWLCPRSNSYETVEDGRFRFHVEISLPELGLIVHYRGWLVPSDGPKISS